MWCSAQPSINCLFEQGDRLKATDCNAYARANIPVLFLIVLCRLFLLCVNTDRDCLCKSVVECT